MVRSGAMGSLRHGQPTAWPAHAHAIDPSADTDCQEATMDDRDNPLRRLGPATGSPPPRVVDARVYRWEWGPDEGRRPGPSWIGIFLLVFGGLLLVQQAYPELESAGAR